MRIYFITLLRRKKSLFTNKIPWPNTFNNAWEVKFVWFVFCPEKQKKMDYTEIKKPQKPKFLILIVLIPNGIKKKILIVLLKRCCKIHEQNKKTFFKIDKHVYIFYV